MIYLYKGSFISVFHRSCVWLCVAVSYCYISHFPTPFYHSKPHNVILELLAICSFLLALWKNPQGINKELVRNFGAEFFGNKFCKKLRNYWPDSDNILYHRELLGNLLQNQVNNSIVFSELILYIFGANFLSKSEVIMKLLWSYSEVIMKPFQSY